MRGRLVAVSLGMVLFAVRVLGAEVFPERMCAQLPEVDPDVKTWVADVAPELAQVPVRELSEKTALEVFGRAAAAGWGGIDLFTQGVFRESCVFHLPADALRAWTRRSTSTCSPSSAERTRGAAAFRCGASLRGAERSLCSTTGTASCSGMRKSIVTSGSPRGSSMRPPPAVASKTCTGYAPGCCWWDVSTFGPW